MVQILVDERLDLMALHGVLTTHDLAPVRGPIEVPSALMTGAIAAEATAGPSAARCGALTGTVGAPTVANAV